MRRAWRAVSLASASGHHLAGRRVHQRLEQLHAPERIRIVRARPALRRPLERHLPVEMGQDLLLVHAADLARLDLHVLGLARRAQRLGPRAVERVQQRRHRQLALAVDADVGEVLGVEFEIQPRAAVRDHPRREQVLPAAVRLALVVVEEHAGRAVHLADDHALGAVDDERAVVRHQGHVAHVDRLLLDVADRARAGVLVEVPHDQAQGHLERRGVGQAALDALLDVVFRLLELVVDELQPAAAREVVDREDRLEHLLQARVRALVRVDVHLQERLVAGALHVDQIRHRRHFGDAPEALADALAARKRPRDRVHRLSCLAASIRPTSPGSGPGIRKRERGRESTDSRPASGLAAGAPRGDPGPMSHAA